MKAGLEHVIVWEFRVVAGKEAEFIEKYGPEGIWARFFRNGRGYIKTELVRDVADSRRFLTLDYWQAEEDFERFREQNLTEYKRLDEQFAGLTKTETRLGAFKTS